jgi:Ca2+-binding RTX toxin-like protein
MTNIVASKSLVTASPQIDILGFTAGAVTVATAAAYRVTQGTNYDELTGSFTYDSAGRLVGGTITGWKQITDGSVAFADTGTSLPVADFLGLLALNDTDGFLSAVFGHDDKIIGSNVGDIVNGRGDDDSIAGGGGDDLLEGTDDNDTLDGGVANDALLGGSGNDSLLGGAGDDFLDGGAGTDTLAGGAGNDVYFIVDGIGDAIVEASGQGIDAVVTNLANFDLAALSNIEDLRLTAPGSAGTGNALNNHIRAEGGDDTLTGSLGNDTLDGGTGADSLSGGQGNDTYIIDNAGDAVNENPGEGTDTIKTSLSFTLDSPGLANVENLTLFVGAVDGTGNDLPNVITGNEADNNLRGLDGDDTLIGGAGEDLLQGGGGLNVLNGGDGDDTYSVDSAGDKVVEGAGLNAGYDRVGATVSYTLATNVEELVLVGTMSTAPSAGTGNAGNNTILANGNANTLLGLGGADSLDGGEGNDLLDGGAGLDDLKGGLGADTVLGGVGDDFVDGGLGADSMAGGAGNEFYTVDDAGDRVSESPGQGTDTVVSTIDYELGSNLETLLLLDGATAGVGNALNNFIEGTSGNDTLTGGLGNDTLDGGTGADSLIGGKGNDTYIVDDAGDAVSESPGEGTDTVQTTLASLSLAGAAFANVENLSLLDGAFEAIGNNLANVITGNDTSNELKGAGGSDTLIGGLGDDLYIVEDAGDKVVEMAGIDSGFDLVIASVSYTLAANVEQLNLNGTGAIDGTGNAADNVITDVSAGDNKLFGLLGNDFLFGGNGNDTLDGGAGDDTLSSGTGANLLSGGAGNDALFGDGVGDTVAGGAGNDLYRVDSIGVTIVEAAGQGIDTIQTTLLDVSLDTKALANVENLTLTGGASAGTGNALNNAITGRAGDDTLTGGLGDDTLDGAAGADSLRGGKGNDVYVIDDPFNTVTENAGEGLDTVRSSLSTTNLGAAAFADIENLTLAGGALSGQGNGLANIITGNDKDNELIGGGGNDTLLGGAGADTLIGSPDDTVVLMIGGRGSDTYTVQSTHTRIVEAADKDSGTDTVILDAPVTEYKLDANVENLIDFDGAVGTGNASNNRITGGTGDSKLLGLAGNDSLEGGAGSDTLDGGTGDDVLDGGDGHDSLLGGAGNDLLFGLNSDTMAGGAGNDVYSVDVSGDVVIEAAGGGIDTVFVAFAAANYILADNVENLSLMIGFGVGDALAGTGNSLNNEIFGNLNDNRLEGLAGNDTLDGSTGADTLVGGKGNDTYIIDNADDTLIENPGEGTDTIQTFASFSLDTPAIANIENLTLLGTDNIDGIGNAGDNVIIGNDGRNGLDGAAGDDTMIGGKGADTYVVRDAQDKIVELAGADSGYDVVFAAVSYMLSANVEQLELQGSAATGTGNAADNVIIGNAAANKLLGLAGGDGLNGGAGDDTLDGGVGNDLVLGGDGNDSLLGGANDDVLSGDAGADTMAGGAGNDRYVVDSPADRIIEQAGQGTDSVTVEAGSYTLDANVENADLFNNAGAIGNNLANLISGDTIFSGNNALSGGGGNDTLVGGTGSDTMTGGAGRDTYVVAPIDGAPDTITDFGAGPLGDALDLSDLLVGFDAGASNPGDFVQFVNASGDTTVRVDVDGAANGANFVDVCFLLGVTLINANQAAMEGNLVLA